MIMLQQHPFRRPAAAAAADRYLRHICRCAPAWNPQNVANPEVVPSQDLTPEQALIAQLEAIKTNDAPWVDHGVQTMYEFASDAGSMERGRYFGFSKDLYHFDHFLHFKTACAALVDCQSYHILPGPPADLQDRQQQQQQGLQDSQLFYVAVVDNKGSDGGVYEFKLNKQNLGLKAGCWMTKSCIRVLEKTPRAGGS